MKLSRSSPFGGRTRTRVLLVLRLRKESYPREMARILETSLSGVQKALQGLEEDGLLAARNVGRSRVFRLDRHYFAYKPLRRYLKRLAEPEEALRARIQATSDTDRPAQPLAHAESTRK
jgi:DNA-binding transcriptional ArsR family regulator